MFARERCYIDIREKAIREDQVDPTYDSVFALARGQVSGPVKGQLHMACGTGKPYVALRIAQDILDEEKALILFVAPSITSLDHALIEWAQETTVEMNCYVVSQDDGQGKPKKEKILRWQHEVHTGRIIARYTTNRQEKAIHFKEILVAGAGFEPATFRL